VVTWQEKFTLRGDTDHAGSVAVSAAGQRIVSASGDKTVKVWEAPLREN
jgi:WD40 repeat protein